MTKKMQKTVLQPCPQCMKYFRDGRIRRETIQPMPSNPAMAAISRRRNEKICSLCAKAEGLADRQGGMTDVMARIAVGNEFQEALRMPPGMSAVRGLRLFPNLSCDDLVPHLEWLDKAVPEVQS